MNKIHSILPVILVLILTYLLAVMFWLIFTPKLSENPAIFTQAKLVIIEVPGDIFGNKKVPTKEKVVVKKIKQSKLNLQLIGVLFQRENSIAIVSPSDKPALAKNYRVGDKVKVGVVIKEIGTNFVILKRGEKLEKLTFKKDAKSDDIIIGQFKSSRSKLSTVQKSKLDDYRLNIIKNPKKLLSIVSVVPFFSNGKMLGVKVKPNKDKDIFIGLGFKSGDIITKVNNISVNNFSKFGIIRQLIYSNTAFTLQVKRGNETIVLEVSL